MLPEEDRAMALGNASNSECVVPKNKRADRETGAFIAILCSLTGGSEQIQHTKSITNNASVLYK